MYQKLCLSVCLFANSFNAKVKCKIFIKKIFIYIEIVQLPYFVNFFFIKISNSLHSLYVRVKISVMTYLNVKGQGQIDICKISIFSIFY